MSVCVFWNVMSNIFLTEGCSQLCKPLLCRVQCCTRTKLTGVDPQLGPGSVSHCPSASYYLIAPLLLPAHSSKGRGHTGLTCWGHPESGYAHGGLSLEAVSFGRSYRAWEATLAINKRGPSAYCVEGPVLGCWGSGNFGLINICLM